MKKISKILCSIVVFCSLHIATTFAELQTPNQEHKLPFYLKPFTPDKLKEDLDFLFKTIEEVHPNMYAYTPKEEFEQSRDKLYNQITQIMTRLEFYKLVAPIVASLKNGHTYMHPLNDLFGEYVLKGGKMFPLVLYWNGTCVILKSYVCHNDLPLGGEVLNIDNQNAMKFLVRATRYFPSENNAYNLGYLERGSSLPMFLWFEKGTVESMTLRIKAIDGGVKKYIVKSLSQKEIREEVAANITKYASMGKGKGPNYSCRCIPEHNTGLIEFNSFNDLEKFKKFLTETFTKLKKQNISNLIIDIRNNPGGSNLLGDEFLKYLTGKPFLQFEEVELKISEQACEKYRWLKRQYPNSKINEIKLFKHKPIKPGKNPLMFNGKIFVLISHKTASSAMSFAAAIKHFGIGVLVGGETTDTPVNYGHIINFKLPNSGLHFSVACERIVCAGGKENGRGVIPDYEVKQKPEDIAKGVDTVLQFTLNLIKSSEAKKLKNYG